MNASEDLFLTLDKEEVVSGDDPRANFLLVRKGDEIDAATAERYGLSGDVDGDGKAEGGADGTNKAFSSPPETKRQKGRK